MAHLLEKAVSMGVNLQTNTPVSSVSAADESTKDRWVVNTSRGSVETSTLVYATNGYTSALVPEMKEKVVPVRGIVARLAGENAPKMTDSYMMRFSDYEYDYMIPRPDGSIVVGGGRRDYYKDLDEWFDVSDDSRLMDGARNYFDGYMQRHFRGWENSDVRTEDVWTGSKCHLHQRPLLNVSELTDLLPCQLWAILTTGSLMLDQFAENPASICVQDSVGTVCRRSSSAQKPSLPWSSRAMQMMWISLCRTASPGVDGINPKNMYLSRCGNRLRKASLLKHGCDDEIERRVWT